ncbi:ribose-phosphate diphosphokinase [Candidatus Bathyarchaeota archaeon]|nr:ribose-phosphate diphosphokinase [Candidatus Bathyarchaeota archaeon]
MSHKYVIAGPSSQALAVQVSKLLGMPAIETEFKKFPDGENYVRLKIEDEDSLAGSEVFIIQTTDFPQNDHLWELLYLISISRRLQCEKVHAIVPYLAYSRQDKVFRQGEAVSAELILTMIEHAGATSFSTIDIHAPSVLSILSIPSYNLDAMPALAQHLNDVELVNPAVISPDKGSRARSGQFAKLINAELVEFDKSRDTITGEISMDGDAKDADLQGRDVAIADDIIATGGTMSAAISLAKKGGARKLYALCTHPLLIKNACFRLFNAGVEDVIGTNTVSSQVSKVSVAPLIADHVVNL